MEAFDFSLSGAILCYQLTELKIFHFDEISALFTDKKREKETRNANLCWFI